MLFVTVYFIRTSGWLEAAVHAYPNSNNRVCGLKSIGRAHWVGDDSDPPCLTSGLNDWHQHNGLERLFDT
jgi:hypothetical protein